MQPIQILGTGLARLGIVTAADLAAWIHGITPSARPTRPYGYFGAEPQERLMHETGAGPYIQHAVMRSLVARPAAELGTPPEPPAPSNPAATISDSQSMPACSVCLDDLDTGATLL